MKLELKHIVGYLPYGLKWHLPLTSERYESILENECYGVNELNWAIENNYPNAKDYLNMNFTQHSPFIAIEDNELFLGQMKCSLGWEEDDVYLNEMKPILHPLSDLTKEIEINGEKFVPIIELLKIEYPSQDKEGKYSIIEVSEKGYPNAYFKYQANRDITIFTNYIENEKYCVIQKLYEWHFDIHGLIEAGLAIDINTLK